MGKRMCKIKFQSNTGLQNAQHADLILYTMTWLGWFVNGYKVARDIVPSQGGREVVNNPF